MTKEMRKSISEIENLCTILKSYCENNTQTAEVRIILTLVNYLEVKTEELYMLIYK